MIKIETTLVEIAEALGIPVYPCHEVIRRIFLTSQPIPLPAKFTYVIDKGIGNYSAMTPDTLTVFSSQHLGSIIVDKATLHAYIKAVVGSVLDISMYTEYTGPKAPEATGEPWEPKWVPHYPPQGMYAVYPPSGPAE